MPRSPSTLNDVQIRVLKWIGDGCPDGVYTEGYAHRIAARALDARGYIRVSGRGATWSARITESGSSWLEKRTTPPPPAPDTSEADALIQRVIDAGGVLDVTLDHDGWAGATLPSGALVSPARPWGKNLAVRNVGSLLGRNYQYYFENNYDELEPISDLILPPETVALHPVAKRFLASKDISQVTAPHMPRASRVLHSVLVECERRGWTTKASLPPTRDHAGHRWARIAVHVVIETVAGLFAIEISEVPGYGSKAPPVDNGPRSPQWVRRRRTPFVSTGRLQLTLNGQWFHVPQKFRESQQMGATIGSAAGACVREVAVAVLRHEERERAKSAAAAAKREQWERSMARARTLYAEDVRARSIREQAEKWRSAEDIRSYSAALLRASSEAGDAGAVAWATWAAEYADSIDPLRALQRVIPPAQNPQPDDLRPFMGGLSPYGPDAQ